MRKILSLLAVLVLCTVLAFGQTRYITGTVRDNQGEPIPFTSVSVKGCLLYTSPSPRDGLLSRMPSSA